MSEEREQLHGKDPGHEPLSVSVRAIAIGTISLVALIVATLLAMGWLSPLLTPRDAADGAGTVFDLRVEAPQTTVGLNPNQAQDRLQLEQRQRAWLSGYAWLDDDEQVARIPIKRAVQFIQERGLDAILEGEDPQSDQQQQGEDRGDSS